MKRRKLYPPKREKNFSSRVGLFFLALTFPPIPATNDLVYGTEIKQILSKNEVTIQNKRRNEAKANGIFNQKFTAPSCEEKDFVTLYRGKIFPDRGQIFCIGGGMVKVV